MNYKIITTAFILLILPVIALAQIASGGGLTLEKSVAANGGGTSSGNEFTLTGTSGQTAAGASLSASPFLQRSGFWVPDQFAPTAARVSIGGRVSTAGGAGIRNVLVTLTDARGAVRTTYTGSFGLYRFTDVEVGEIYILTVRAKKYSFASPEQIVSVNDELTNLDFVAGEN